MNARLLTWLQVMDGVGGHLNIGLLDTREDDPTLLLTCQMKPIEVDHPSSSNSNKYNLVDPSVAARV